MAPVSLKCSNLLALIVYLDRTGVICNMKCIFKDKIIGEKGHAFTLSFPQFHFIA